MNITDFFKTIYVGDRGCKSIIIGGWNSEVKIQVSCISRVRSASWDFYTDEDLIDGYLVFEKVESINFSPEGLLPNDTINDIQIVSITKNSEKCRISISIDSVNHDGSRSEVHVFIVASSAALEDSDQHKRIRE
jgi:hypothetical protein